MTPARLERATFGLGTPGTGSQAFPTLPCSLESGEIRLNPPGCFPCLSLPFPTVIQSTSKVGEVSLCSSAFGQSKGKVVARIPPSVWGTVLMSAPVRTSPLDTASLTRAMLCLSLRLTYPILDARDVAMIARGRG